MRIPGARHLGSRSNAGGIVARRLSINASRSFSASLDSFSHLSHKYWLLTDSTRLQKRHWATRLAIGGFLHDVGELAFVERHGKIVEDAGQDVFTDKTAAWLGNKHFTSEVTIVG